mmetsp:Transcript_11871/g.19116  ORF Transcript_11871/g.19116 Transcript_11871/m.19116 type:complete len:223 (+) Transcript_11871:862-1530(+)
MECTSLAPCYSFALPVVAVTLTLTAVPVLAQQLVAAPWAFLLLCLPVSCSLPMSAAMMKTKTKMRRKRKRKKKKMGFLICCVCVNVESATTTNWRNESVNDTVNTNSICSDCANTKMIGSEIESGMQRATLSPILISMWKQCAISTSTPMYISNMSDSWIWIAICSMSICGASSLIVMYIANTICFSTCYGSPNMICFATSFCCLTSPSISICLWLCLWLCL